MMEKAHPVGVQSNPDQRLQGIRHLNVSDIMTAKPVTVRQDSTLRQALEAMEQAGCQHLPVLSVDGHLVGILSDRDIRQALNLPQVLREHWEEDDVANHLLVRTLMTPAPITTEPDSSADEAARLMLVNRISCLPVMRSETLVGIVTKSDILMAFMRMSKSVPA
jgi:acetoin utilization protein AcuB